MEIKAKCVFDYESMKALTYVSTYKRKNPRKSFVFTNIWCVVLVLLLMIEMMFFDVDIQLVVLLVVAAILVVVNCFMYCISPKIQFKALHNLQNMENEYTFYSDSIKVISKNKDYNGEAEIKYSVVPKVMETSKYVFIYQSKNQVFIVDKSTITNGTINDIRNILIPFVKNKYIICKY